jgi:hypothetical protein
MNGDCRRCKYDTKHKKPRGRRPTGRYYTPGIPDQQFKSNAGYAKDAKHLRKWQKVVLEDGQKQALCKKCGEIIDTLKEAKAE